MKYQEPQWDKNETNNSKFKSKELWVYDNWWNDINLLWIHVKVHAIQKNGSCKK